ncbi:MAG TPA: HRDC domain-containing protein [Symbiobacteriaceae bacterium]|jgi:ribonuclease D|nr:HRDC domain-containing protein [Symbiobacteriaceae bacterium]
MDTIYARLKAWRFETARSLGVPSFFILSNAHLAGVALARPMYAEELAACPGMGPKKMAQFGADLLAQVQACLAEGLEPGVVPLAEPVPAQNPLSESDFAEIAAGLRKELARQLVRRFKGRYSEAQVVEALRRFGLPA